MTINRTIQRKKCNPIALLRLKTLRRVALATAPQNGWRRSVTEKDFHHKRHIFIRWLMVRGYLENNPIYLIDGRVLDSIELTALGRYCCETGRL